MLLSWELVNIFRFITNGGNLMESNGPIENVFSEFDAKCDEIKSYIMGESQKQTIYHVEKGMLSLIMSFGLICLHAFLRIKGDGTVGPTIKRHK